MLRYNTCSVIYEYYNVIRTILLVITQTLLFHVILGISKYDILIYCIIGINAIYNCHTNLFILFLFKDTHDNFMIFFSSPHLAICICITSIFDHDH